MHLRKKTIRFLEFALIGVLMGTVEDTVAMFFVTGEIVTFDTIWIIMLVAIPFAFFSEYIVDHPKFWERLNVFKKEDDKKNNVEEMKNTL